MNKVFLPAAVFTFIINFCIFSQNDLSGYVYFTYSKEELLKEESRLSGIEDSFEKFAYLGITYHFLSDKGQKTAQKAVDNIEKALALKPDNIVLKAYLGSSYSLLGGEQDTAAKKLKFANIGIKILDEVYGRNKDDYEITVILLYNCINLPDKIFNRLQTAVDIIDLMILNIDKYSKEQAAQILFLKSLTLINLYYISEARIFLERITVEYPGSFYAAEAAEKLKTLK